MGFGTSTIKYILFFFNFAFALSGLALLALGLFTRYYSTKTEELANKASGDAAGLAALAFIIIGGAIFIVSFFGCCGAIRESHCMITMYAMFLLAFFLLEVATGVFLYVNRGQVESITRKSLTTVFDDYSNKSESHAFVDEIQHDFSCCGVDGPNYWTENNAAAIPHSCCRDDGGQGTTCSKAQAWQDGCLQKSIDLVKNTSGMLFKIIMGIAGGEDNIVTTLQKKGTSKRLAVKPDKKPVSKKTKKSTSISCYTDKILDLITDPTIPTDAENTLNIKKDECSLTVKTPVENTAVDYWTIAHYKCAKIANVALQDRWKHAECLLKISLTGQHPDDLNTAKEMVTLIQSVFDRMMKHPNKKLLRHRPKKINL